MTHIRRSLVAFFVLVAVASATMAAPVLFYSSAVDACDQDRTVDRVLRNLKKDGFSLVSVDEQPVYYFVPPTGDFVWGTVTFTNIRKVGGDYSLQTDYAKVQAEVTYYEGRGYKVSKVFTEETTVY